MAIFRRIDRKARAAKASPSSEWLKINNDKDTNIKLINFCGLMSLLYSKGHLSASAILIF